MYMCGVVASKGNTMDFYLREKGRLGKERRLLKTSQVNQLTLRFYRIVIDSNKDIRLFLSTYPYCIKETTGIIPVVLT